MNKMSLIETNGVKIMKDNTAIEILEKMKDSLAEKVEKLTESNIELKKELEDSLNRELIHRTNICSLEEKNEKLQDHNSILVHHNKILGDTIAKLNEDYKKSEIYKSAVVASAQLFEEVMEENNYRER